MAVRIVTWNLWWRFGPWEERQQAIIATLRELDPDVIALQEVWSAGGTDLAAVIAEELGLEHVFGPAGVPPYWQGHADPSVGVGNALLSRWPLVGSGVRPLPYGDGPPEGRVAVHALVDTGSARFPVITTHLHAAPAGSAVRTAQVDEVARLVAEIRPGGDFPTVVTGDFNAESDSDEMRRFAGVRTAPAVPGQAMIDVWRHAAPGAPWATWSAANPYVRHPMDVDARIDYIHLSMPPLGTPGPFGIRDVRVAGDRPVDGVWPSDHFAVVADLISPVAP